VEMHEDHPKEREPSQNIERYDALALTHAGGVTKKNARPSRT
jgi:hypothetical protein